MSNPAPSRKPRRPPRAPPGAAQRILDLLHKLLTGGAALGMLVKMIFG
jgi:hypothetical protein